MARRRVDLVECGRRRSSCRLWAAGTHPWARWQDQQVIDTPHYHIVESTLRYVAWRNNTFGLHVHVGIHGADRAIAVHQRACAPCCPSCWRFSSSSPWLEGRHTHLHSTRTEIFTRFFPRCGIPDSFAGWEDYAAFVRFLIDTRLDPRAHRDLVERAARTRPTPPSRRGSATASRSSRGRSALAGLMVAADRRLRPPLRRRRAAARPSAPRPRGEPVAGDPLGHVGRADRPRRAPRDPGRGSGSSSCSTRWPAPPTTWASRRTWRCSAPPTLVSSVLAEPMEAGDRPRELWPSVVDRTRALGPGWLR